MRTRMNPPRMAIPTFRGARPEAACASRGKTRIKMEHGRNRNFAESFIEESSKTGKILPSLRKKIPRDLLTAPPFIF
jgi:hypothetical protein